MKNDPAYPLVYQPITPDGTPIGPTYLTYGLTKREYFAGLAMQGLCAKQEHFYFKEAAREAVAYADALLKELEESDG